MGAVAVPLMEVMSDRNRQEELDERIRPKVE